MQPIRLGDKVKDCVSGFEGIVIAKTDWLYGCVRFGVEAQELRDGKLIEAQWFDEPRLVLVATQAELRRAAQPGGGGQEEGQRRSETG